MLAASAAGAGRVSAQTECPASENRVGWMEPAGIDGEVWRDALFTAGVVPAGTEMVRLEKEGYPVLRDREKLAREMVRGASSLYPDAVGAHRETWVTFRVEPDGTVSQSVVSRSSGHAAVDEYLRAQVLRMRFDPARIDGCPVAAWAQVPLSLRRS